MRARLSGIASTTSSSIAAARPTASSRARLRRARDRRRPVRSRIAQGLGGGAAEIGTDDEGVGRGGDLAFPARHRLQSGLAGGQRLGHGVLEPPPVGGGVTCFGSPEMGLRWGQSKTEASKTEASKTEASKIAASKIA